MPTFKVIIEMYRKCEVGRHGERKSLTSRVPEITFQETCILSLPVFI